MVRFASRRIPAQSSGSDKTPIGVRRQFSSIELFSLLDGRCSPPSSLEYAPSGAQSKREGGCVGSACACGWGTTPTPPACAAIAQSPFCPTHSVQVEKFCLEIRGVCLRTWKAPGGARRGAVSSPTCFRPSPQAHGLHVLPATSTLSAPSSGVVSARTPSKTTLATNSG